MGDSELRRVMRVVFGAIDQVRDAYRAAENETGSASASQTMGETLERVGRQLWDVHGNLLTESPERYVEDLRQAALSLRREGRALARRKQRDLADTLLDAADALEAWIQITQIALEAGLAG